MSTDRELVADVLSGKPEAFARLVHAHHALCWHLLLRLTRNQEDARELCQETFLRVHQRLPQFRFESSLRTWIGRIAYSIGLRHVERTANHPETSGGGVADDLAERVASHDDVGAGAELAHARVLLDIGMRSLTPVQRTLVTLYHIDEMSIGEIMQVTGLPSGTIKVYLARARLSLRDALNPMRNPGHED